MTKVQIVGNNAYDKLVAYKGSGKNRLLNEMEDLWVLRFLGRYSFLQLLSFLCWTFQCCCSARTAWSCSTTRGSCWRRWSDSKKWKMVQSQASTVFMWLHCYSVSKRLWYLRLSFKLLRYLKYLRSPKLLRFLTLLEHFDDHSFGKGSCAGWLGHDHEHEKLDRPMQWTIALVGRIRLWCIAGLAHTTHDALHTTHYTLHTTHYTLRTRLLYSQDYAWRTAVH